MIDLDRLETLLDAARRVEGCTDHGCVLRVFPRGGMGTNGGCNCVGRNRTDDGLMVYAARYDLMRLLTLARHTPALVDEVKHLRSDMESMARVMESMARVMESVVTLMERSVPLCACGDLATYTDPSRTRYACDRHRDDDGWVELSWAGAARNAVRVLKEVDVDPAAPSR